MTKKVQRFIKCPKCHGHGEVPAGRTRRNRMKPEYQAIIDATTKASDLDDAKDKQIADLQAKLDALTPKMVTLASVQKTMPGIFWYEARSKNDPHTGPHGTVTIVPGEPATADFHPVNLGGPSDNVYLPVNKYPTLSDAEKTLMESALKFSIGCDWLVNDWSAPQALELDYQIQKVSGILINIGLQFIRIGSSWILRGFDYVNGNWVPLVGGITPTPGKPVSVKIEATCDDKTVTFTQVTIDGKVSPVSLNHLVTLQPKGKPECRVAWQLDGNAKGTAYEATIGNLTATFA